MQERMHARTHTRTHARTHEHPHTYTQCLSTVTTSRTMYNKLDDVSK